MKSVQMKRKKRLSVFEGSFSEEAAKEVIEKDKLYTSRNLFLKA